MMKNSCSQQFIRLILAVFKSELFIEKSSIYTLNNLLFYNIMQRLNLYKSGRYYLIITCGTWSRLFVAKK